MSVLGPAAMRRLAVLLMGGALISKVLGLVREMLTAQVIGASFVADAFRGGLTAVLLPLAFVQNESVPAILIPAYREWQSQEDAPRRFTALTVALTLAAFLLFLLVEVSAPFWIDILLGGFTPSAHALTLEFTRVMALAMPASVLLCCLSAAEISCGQSRLTSIRAMLVNVAVIGGVILLLATGQPVALAWSFSFAFNAVCALGLMLLVRERMLDFSGLQISAVWHAGCDFLRRFRPILLQPLAEYGQIWTERLLASSLAVGTLASLDYARTLSDCAVLLISQPLGLMVLSAGPSRDVRAQAASLIRPILAIGLPASISLVVFAPEVVTLVFHRGAFDFAAITSTASALRGIAIGVWATTLGWVLVRILNSAGRNRRATFIIACALLANAAISLLLVPSLGVFALGCGEAVRGIVLLTGVAYALQVGDILKKMLLLAAAPALLLLGLDLTVLAGLQGVLPRLLAASAATVLAVGLSLFLMVPSIRVLLLSFRLRPIGGRA